MENKSAGFTLIELLVVLVIISVLSIIIFTLLNPLEINRQARDAVRLSDLANLQQALVAKIGDPDTDKNFLCNGSSGGCVGNSLGNRNVNGSGWIKANFDSIQGVTFHILPIDPVNLEPYFYTYSSNGNNFELNAKIESVKFLNKSQSDGGNNPEVYEIGTNLTLLP